MKKILLMAMAAIAFMACENNGGGTNLPSKDKAAVDKVSAGAVALIGENPGKVQQALTSAGFVKAEESIFEAPRRIQGKLKAPADALPSDYYVYGVDPKDIQKEVSETEAEAAIQKALEKGAVIITSATFLSNELYIMESYVMLKWEKNCSRIYTDASDALYNKMPANAVQKQWQGSIGKTIYEKHNEFVAAIAAAEDGIEANESGAALTSLTDIEGFAYGASWAEPGEEDRENMELFDGSLPYAVASFVVGNVSAYIDK